MVLWIASVMDIAWAWLQASASKIALLRGLKTRMRYISLSQWCLFFVVKKMTICFLVKTVSGL